MQIALIGYGKMGKTIEPMLETRGHGIHAIFDSRRKPKTLDLQGADVAIEFTRPELALEHIRICAEAGCPIVTGTTGWNHQLGEALAVIQQFNGAMFYASNFSLGVNIAFHLTEVMSSLLAKFPEYMPSIEEIHHIQKLDAPSGTAITFADKIIDNHQSFSGWKLSEKSDDNKIPIHSIREGNVTGTHHVRFTSSNDQIEISHTAFNRNGFASGAITAAEFLVGKSGIYTMADLIKTHSSFIQH